MELKDLFGNDYQEFCQIDPISSPDGEGKRLQADTEAVIGKQRPGSSSSFSPQSSPLTPTGRQGEAGGTFIFDDYFGLVCSKCKKPPIHCYCTPIILDCQEDNDCSRCTIQIDGCPAEWGRV